MNRSPDASLVDRIDALLPQTQCRRCGEDGYRPYAQAVADGRAPINRCPPGGPSTLAAMATLLQAPPIPLDGSRGKQQPFAIAFIDEAACIGCTLCIQACPTDAIVGAAKQMHTVIIDRCTGCELCLPPCPVDCIAMLPADTRGAMLTRTAHADTTKPERTTRAQGPVAQVGRTGEPAAAVKNERPPWPRRWREHEPDDPAQADERRQET
jgi:electron transport complex protein RnfB